MKPLAEIMRPHFLEDFIGQNHILSKDKPLYNLIINKRTMNMIFYGPPGTGKTSLANIISNYADRKFYKINATTSSVKEIQEIINTTNTLLEHKGIILYIDEIQYFNKKQQQSILEFIEDGRVILIGSTTENPYFAIHKALISRCTIFQFEPLTTNNVIEGLKKVMNKLINENYNITEYEEGIKYIADISQGDLRKAYTIFELAVNSQSRENIRLNLDFLHNLNQSSLRWDASTDEYYNVLSAFQKSIRGSAPDAAIHYLSRLIKGGNIDSIIRRLAVIAAEDIGLAHPQALNIVNSGIELVIKVGLPEASLILSELTIYLATLPKSNSSMIAISQAMGDIDKINIGDVPMHLKDAHYQGANSLGVKGYIYPHDYNNHYVKQQYMPKNLETKKYYVPQQNKYETSIKAFWDKIKNENL
ncbi:replication-associated recombination protein A [Clostridium sp. 19966]|uniref:replication-associated recombination protein A n=1 Tax=Clostridium sp. 19966 TaxID=2768166 RepID=UPI0028E0069F|nr:replication-associated recombination protein A [Clostridium sp. 19966]MDT8716268.1 replication-associated recombination protein A [Clostridium sp. 19966]